MYGLAASPLSNIPSWFCADPRTHDSGKRNTTLPRSDARHTTSLEDLRHLIVEYSHVCASLCVVVPRAGSVSEMR